MADLDFALTIRFDGLDADKHEIDLFSLGESLKGMARIAAVAGHFAATQQYSRYFIAHDVKVVAREPVANCFSIPLAWTWVQQHQILSGSFGVIIATLIPYIFAKHAQQQAEMKLLKDSLDNAIRELGSRDEQTIGRLLDIVEKMAEDLRPAVRQAVSPIGITCTTMTLKHGEVSRSFDHKDKEAINRSVGDEITELREFVVLMTELDLERGTCKVRIEGQPENKRFNATITDPLIKTAGSSYAMAFAAESQIGVRAKAQLKDGEITKLFISDLA